MILKMYVAQYKRITLMNIVAKIQVLNKIFNRKTTKATA